MIRLTHRTGRNMCIHRKREREREREREKEREKELCVVRSERRRRSYTLIFDFYPRRKSEAARLSILKNLFTRKLGERGRERETEGS